jgi:hypothetical protein
MGWTGAPSLTSGGSAAAAGRWFAFVGSVVLLALLWKELARIAHAEEAHLAA